MPERQLEDIAAWGGAHGYEALGVAAWPVWGASPEKVKAGVEIAHRTLRPLLVR
jgi:hypothetical protein